MRCSNIPLLFIASMYELCVQELSAIKDRLHCVTSETDVSAVPMQVGSKVSPDKRKCSPKDWSSFISPLINCQQCLVHILLILHHANTYINTNIFISSFRREREREQEMEKQESNIQD